MRTVCPSCQAAYDVPAAVLASGRTLRCARCGADFTPEAPPLPDVGAPVPDADDAPADFAPAFVAPAPVSAERLVSPAVADKPDTTSGPRPAVVAGWVVTLLVLVALGWGFVAWRGAIQRVWPASGRVYAVLGFK